MMVSKRNLLLQGTIFRFHFKLLEGMYGIRSLDDTLLWHHYLYTLYVIKSKHLSLLSLFLPASTGQASLFDGWNVKSVVVT